MKNILIAVLSTFAFASCVNNVDCECTYSTEDVHNVYNYNIVVKDWDGNCESIDYGNIHLDNCTFDLYCTEI